MRSLRIHPSAIPPWREPALAESARPIAPPVISRRQYARLAPRLTELWTLVETLHDLPPQAPLAPELQRRAHNAITLADRVIATLPIDPPPPLEGVSNTDYGVAMLMRLIGVSRFVTATDKNATRRNIEAAPARYKFYPRASSEA